MADEKRQEVQAWLQKADNDLRSARVDLAAEPPLIEDALFHCQQAAEKAVDAIRERLRHSSESAGDSNLRFARGQWFSPFDACRAITTARPAQCFFSHF